jgi:hypothetical protein
MDIRNQRCVADWTANFKYFTCLNLERRMFHTGIIADLRTQQEKSRLFLIVSDHKDDVVSNTNVTHTFGT